MCKLARRNRRWRRATQPTSSQPCEGRPSVLPSCLPSPLSLFEHIQAQRAAVIFNGFPTNFTRQQNLLKKKKKKTLGRMGLNLEKTVRLIKSPLVVVPFCISESFHPGCPHPASPPLPTCYSPIAEDHHWGGGGGPIWICPPGIALGYLNKKHYHLPSKMQLNVHSVSFLSLRSLVSSCFSDKNCNAVNRLQWISVCFRWRIVHLFPFFSVN